MNPINIEKVNKNKYIALTTNHNTIMSNFEASYKLILREIRKILENTEKELNLCFHNYMTNL